MAIVAVVLVGWFWWESRQWEDTDDAQIDGHIYPISARVNGHVIKVNFDDGQLVHKGDVLVVIDPTDYTVALGTCSRRLSGFAGAGRSRALRCAGVEHWVVQPDSFGIGRHGLSAGGRSSGGETGGSSAYRKWWKPKPTR